MVSIGGAVGAPSPAPTAAVSDIRRCDNKATAEYWRTYDTVTYTRSVFAGLSIITSMAVLSVGYAYGKDRRSLQGRIIAGLFVSNLVFAIGMSVPVGTSKCVDGNFVSIHAWRISTRFVVGALIYSGKVCPAPDPPDPPAHPSALSLVLCDVILSSLARRWVSHHVMRSTGIPHDLLLDAVVDDVVRALHRHGIGALAPVGFDQHRPERRARRSHNVLRGRADRLPRLRHQGGTAVGDH